MCRLAWLVKFLSPAVLANIPDEKLDVPVDLLDLVTLLAGHTKTASVLVGDALLPAIPMPAAAINVALPTLSSPPNAGPERKRPSSFGKERRDG